MKRTYMYFLVQRETRIDGQEPILGTPRVIRGLSRKTVERRLTNEDFEATMRADYGGSYAPYYDTKIISAFQTYEEASEECIRLQMKMAKDRWIDK